VILLARLLALESRLEEIAETLAPGLRAMLVSDWKVGYDLFIEQNPEVDKSTKEKLRVCVDEFAVLSQLLQESSDSPAAIASALETCLSFRQLVERERPKKIAALIENKVLDAHFLPVIRPSESLGEGPGYVILFRQILALPGNLLAYLKDGLTSVDELPVPLKTLADQALECPSEIAANVASPHVEHILQRFATVFGRVGVADCSKRYREWLVNTVCEGIKQ